MKKTPLVFTSSFALLLPLFSLTSADAYEDFTLDAKAGLLIEADTGEILYERSSGKLSCTAQGDGRARFWCLRPSTRARLR